MPKERFPELAWDDYFPFPDPRSGTEEGIVAQGGNLSPGMLLSAYRQGCFPWYSDDSPILWWNPDPRFVLYPNEVHVSESLAKVLKKNPFEVTFDTAFSDVILNCQNAKRPGQNGTWITRAVVEGYTKLHELGFAHSCEVWQGEERKLVGGLYGIHFGKVFYGESMFALESNASKVGFVRTVDYLVRAHGVRLIDCQAPTKYLASFGAKPIPRDRFLAHLAEWVEFPPQRDRWISP